MRGAVASRAFELQHDVTGAVALEPFVGDRGPGDVAPPGYGRVDYALRRRRVQVWEIHVVLTFDRFGSALNQGQPLP